MRNGAIRTINIDDFKAFDHIIDYADDDIAVINSLNNIPYSNDTLRLNCVLVMFCTEGYLQMDMNNKTFLLENNSLMICLPNSILSHTMVSPSHTIKIIGFSTGFMRRVVKMGKDIWKTVSYVYNNPIKHVGESDYLPFKLYIDAIMAKINSLPHLYRKEIIQHLFSALFCEVIADLNKHALVSYETGKSKETIKQADFIFTRFMEKLSIDNGLHRSVSYYADELFYTSKYLSKVIKQVSGKTALDLINEHAIEHIKYQLKHSDKSIKEIAEEFQFSNLSFFGKYIKAHLGVSPTRYRNSSEL